MSEQIIPIFLRLHPRDIAMAKFVFESYEGVAVVRTLDRRAAVIVVLAVADFANVARDIVVSLHAAMELEEIAPPADVGADWLLAALASEEEENVK